MLKERYQTLKPGMAPLFCLAALLPGMVLGLLLTGCPAQMPAQPNGFLESIEAANVTLDTADKKAATLTCQTFTDGKCTQPGLSINPDDAIAFHQKIVAFRGYLKLSANAAPGGLVACGADTVTREQCVANAQQLLNLLEGLIVKH